MWHFGPLSAIADIFSWVGIDFIWQTDRKEPNPTGLSTNNLFLVWFAWLVWVLAWLLSCLLGRLVAWLLGLMMLGWLAGRSVRRSVD